jgi:hypothetical protein
MSRWHYDTIVELVCVAALGFASLVAVILWGVIIARMVGWL